MLLRAGARTGGVVSTGPNKGSGWACSVHGVPTTLLTRWRASAAACTSMADRGGSPTAKLLVAGAGTRKVDPAYDAHRGPIVAWAGAWHDTRGPPRKGDINRKVLQQCFCRAIRRIGYRDRPWGLVRGPAGATVATLRRLGWQVISPGLWKDDRGVLIDLERWGPAYIGKTG